jgi:hypothetical protein
MDAHSEVALREIFDRIEGRRRHALERYARDMANACRAVPAARMLCALIRQLQPNVRTDVYLRGDADELHVEIFRGRDTLWGERVASILAEPESRAFCIGVALTTSPALPAIDPYRTTAMAQRVLAGIRCIQAAVDAPPRMLALLACVRLPAEIAKMIHDEFIVPKFPVSRERT